MAPCLAERGSKSLQLIIVGNAVVLASTNGPRLVRGVSSRRGLLFHDKQISDAVGDTEAVVGSSALNIVALGWVVSKRGDPSVGNSTCP